MRSEALLMVPWIGFVVGGCGSPRPAQDPVSWFDAGSDYDVLEPVAYTDQNYTFRGDTAIADLPLPPAFQVWFAPEDDPAVAGCADWEVSAELPREITGVVTLLPRFYFKTYGCDGDDEKFYGSYFVQDSTGGFFVLGDSKVAHFDMGARVTLEVRAVRESFQQYMIAAHDVLTVDRSPEPIYYQTVTTALGPSEVAQVVRVTGTVRTEATTFGEIYFAADNGVDYKLSLDAELSRRGINYPVGTRIQATGPVLYSFSEYTLVVMRLGQIEVL